MNGHHPVLGWNDSSRLLLIMALGHYPGGLVGEVHRQKLLYGNNILDEDMKCFRTYCDETQANTTID